MLFFTAICNIAAGPTRNGENTDSEKLNRNGKLHIKNKSPEAMRSIRRGPNRATLATGSKACLVHLGSRALLQKPRCSA